MQRKNTINYNFNIVDIFLKHQLQTQGMFNSSLHLFHSQKQIKERSMHQYRPLLYAVCGTEFVVGIKETSVCS